MTFSIVIQAYNGSKFIEKAILSALHQTRKPDEIIVHDDNSSDSTRQICQKYFPEIIYYFNPDGPSGFVNGWNKAISFAKSDFIAILHQDDLLYPTFLEEAEQALMSNSDVRHLFALCDYIGADDEVTKQRSESVLKGDISEETIKYNGKEYVKTYQKTYNGMPHIHRCPGVITHRSIFEDGCLYNPKAGHIADDDFFYRVGQFTNVIGIMKSLAAYRIHVDSETGKIGNNELVERLAHDYIFQVKQWQNSIFLDNKDKYYFEYWAIKYLFQLFFYASKTSNKEKRINAEILYQEFRQLQFSNTHFKELFKLKLVRKFFK